MSPLALCDAGRTQLPKISQYVTVSESDHHRSPCVQSWHTRRHYCDDGGVISRSEVSGLVRLLRTMI